MTLQRPAVVLLGLVFVAFIGLVVWSTVTDDEGRPSDTPSAPATERAQVDGGGESVPPSGSAGRVLAGFVLVVGWGIGVAVVIVRAQRRRPSLAAANGADEEAQAGG